MADRYWVGGGSSSAWNATGLTNWGTVSGGAPNASVPTSADNVIFDGAGSNGNTTMTMVATGNCLTLLITSGYTATFNHSQTIVANGSVTLGVNLIQAGTGQLTVAGTATLTSNGKIWTGILAFTTSSSVKTLADNWEINGLLNVANIAVMNGNTMRCNGITAPTNITGSTAIFLTGGTWSGAGVISNNLTLDGNVTVSGTVTYNTNTLKYLSGTITVTGSTLQTNNSCTIDTAGMVWNRVIPITTTQTITILSELSSDRIECNSGTVTFAGTAGWTCNLFNWVFTAATTTIFQVGIEYKVNTQFTCNQARSGSIVTLISSSATVRALITLAHGATCNTNARFTRIDASNGRSINTWNALVTNCINVNSFVDYNKVALTF